MKLLLGTTNPAKVADYNRYLVHSKLEIITLRDLRFFDEPLEIGETFEENALQKARFYAEKTELPTLADDGGFEVDALGGEPGINSRRWVGPNGTDEDRIDKIIKRLRGIPAKGRTAHFRIVVVVYFPDIRDYVSVEKITESGVVPEQPSKVRISGYPYRSVLFLPQLNKYFSELTQDELQEIDHRKAACKELLLKLGPWISS